MKLADLTKGVSIGGRFRLTERLGTGTYGDVWLADVLLPDEGLPPKVALKIYTDQERANKVLFKEAGIAIGLDNDCIVKVYDADRIDGLFMMWMDYVEGRTLNRFVGGEDHPWPVRLDDVLCWLLAVAKALGYLHGLNPPCVHGDLKLENIIQDKNGRVRLLDFGQSRAIEDLFVETAGGGTWPYLAPEVLGEEIDCQGVRFVASDIYAFGVLAYRIVTGRFPRKTPHEIFNQAPFPKPTELNSAIPRDLEAIILKCLAKKPQHRFANGLELIAALQTIDPLAQYPEPVTVQPIESSTLTQKEYLADLVHELIDSGAPEKALDRIQKEMERFSTSPHLLMLYAVAARAGGHLDAALLVYRRAIAWHRMHGAPNTEIRAVMEGRAEMEVALKKYEEACESFGWLTENWPENRWYRYRLAVALGLSGRYSKSLSILLDLHRDDRSTALISAKIGLCYMQMRDIPRAREYFNEALMRDACEPYALFHLARIRWLEGRPDLSQSYLSRLGQIDGAEDLYQQLFRLMAGREC
jgi:serine/threonine-protein kinase